MKFKFHFILLKLIIKNQDLKKMKILYQIFETVIIYTNNFYKKVKFIPKLFISYISSVK